MNEFRRFCIGGFATSSITAAMANHGWAALAPGSAWEQMTTAAILGGCFAVTVFGKRGDA